MLNTEGNSVLVCARVKPASGTSASCVRVAGDGTCVVLESPAAGELGAAAAAADESARVFGFDSVFPGRAGSVSAAAAQEELFRAVGQPLADACMAGYNVTVFAYGQTGSGKSYTMMGYQDAATAADVRAPRPGCGRAWDECGLAPRIIEYLFEQLAKASQEQQQQQQVQQQQVQQVQQGQQATKCEYTCKCTMLEIYNETIVDLLDGSGAAGHLQLREDWQRGVFVDGLTEETAASWAEAYGVLCRGLLLRTTGETQMNPRSSRSHCVFTVDVQARTTEASGVVALRHARLNLVDLAGSERQRSTAAAGVRLKEAGQINRSLTVLSAVIRSLGDVASGKERYIRYRDSKLTFLLKDSLGGNSKTCIIATVAQDAPCYAETLSTLMFAERAKLIRNKAVVNEHLAGNAAQLQAELKRVKDELEAYKAQAALLSQGATNTTTPDTQQEQEHQEQPLLMGASAYLGTSSRRKSMRSLRSLSRRGSLAPMMDAGCEGADGAAVVTAAALAEARREFEEETTSMELVLLRMQERNQELCSDTAALREQVSVLQEALAEHEHVFYGLRFALRLRDDALRAVHAGATTALQDAELARLRQENEALHGFACDYAAFARLRVQVYLLREAESRRAQAPSTFREWENRVQELSALVTDLEKKCRDLLARVHRGGDGDPDDMQLVRDGEDDDGDEGHGETGAEHESLHSPVRTVGDDNMDLESPVKKPRHSGSSSEDGVDSTSGDALHEEVARLREENARLAREAEAARKRAEQVESDFVGMGEALERSEKENTRLRRSVAAASTATKAAAAAEAAATATATERGDDGEVEALRSAKERIERQHSKLVQTLEDVEKRRAGERAEALKVIAQKARELSAKDEAIAALQRAQEQLRAQLAAVQRTAAGSAAAVGAERPGRTTQQVLQEIEAMSDSDNSDHNDNAM